MRRLVHSTFGCLICSFFLLLPPHSYAQCDSASFEIEAITPLGNDQYEMQLTFCAPAGYDAAYFYQNTGSFAFFLDGATLLGYPDSIESSLTGSTYYGYSLFTDTVLYFENHYPHYWGYSDEWWVCNDGNCGSPQSYCKTITIQIQGLAESITLKGISGGGNPAAGCPMTVMTDCFYSNFDVSIGGDTQVTLGTDNTCTELIPQITGGSGDYSYLWCTGETTATIHPCPEETRTYHLLVTDNQMGCQAEAVLDVQVNDIRCGGDLNKVQVCYRNQTYCVSQRRANRLINKKGATLGTCSGASLRLTNSAQPPLLRLFETDAYQDGDKLNVSILTDEKSLVELMLYSLDGKRYDAPRPFQLRENTENEIALPVSQLSSGVYLLIVRSGSEQVASQKIMINN